MDFFNTIIYNPLYAIIFMIMAAVLVFSIWKKIMKLIISTVVVLILFLIYLYFSGENILDDVKKLPVDMKKVEKKLKSGEKDIKKKSENMLKNIRKEMEGN